METMELNHLNHRQRLRSVSLFTHSETFPEYFHFPEGESRSLCVLDAFQSNSQPGGGGDCSNLCVDDLRRTERPVNLFQK